MEPALFSEKDCQLWKKRGKVQKCCKSPHYIPFLKQDRAMDESPTLYQQCKNCKRILRKKG